MRQCAFSDTRNRERCTECGATIDLCLCPDVAALASRRLFSDQGEFLRAVAHQIFEEQNASESHLFEELVKIVGELGIQLVTHNAARTPEPAAIRKTLIEIAALAARLATEGTPEYAFPAE